MLGNGLITSKIIQFSILIGLITAPINSYPLTSGDIEALRDIANRLKGEYQKIQSSARNAASSESGAAGCHDYERDLSPKIQEFARLAQLSSNIYLSGVEKELKLAGSFSKSYINENGGRVLGLRDPASDGYAEIHFDEIGDGIVIVFRGTKILSIKDISTNVEQFSNILPERYKWADNLVSRVRSENKDSRIIVTGHSLGGGLAMYTGVREMLETVVFNPAGLSRGVLNDLSLSVNQWKSANGKMVAFMARSGQSIDPISALSLSGRTVVAGRRYIVDLPLGLTPFQQHEIDRIADFLSAAPDRIVKCPNDLGFQKI